MVANPILGVFFHWLGGLASASFYVPYRKVRLWSWETYWLVGGVFSWIIAPWLMALLLTRDPIGVLAATPGRTLFWAWFFGVLWGVGGLTFGLTMRYLGLSLGMAVALGLCAAFGTLMPPVFNGEFMTKVLGTHPGQMILLGIGVCVAGIALAGVAGIFKERNMSPEQRRAVIREFDLKKGLLVAILCGVMSACFSFGLAAGIPIRRLTLQAGTSELWQGLPVLVVVLLGGFLTNFVWTMLLHARNRSGGEYFRGTQVSETEAVLEASSGAGVSAAAVAVRAPVGTVKVPLAANYLFCAFAGVTWYMQFFFYTMGETQMGAYSFSSWTMHMASIIIFRGIGLHEWKGAGRTSIGFLGASLLLLVLSTVIIGYGNYLGAR